MRPMQIKMNHPRFLIVLVSCCLSACSGNLHTSLPYEPVRSFDRETADLAEVTADVIDQVEHAGVDNVLMVFDIDNTILAMEQGLGSDQWYEWQKELSNEEPCSPHNTGDRFAAQGALFFASAMRPTQADAAEQVSIIQDSGVAVIAVTSRGQQYRLQTFRELRRAGYNFSHSAIGPPGGYKEPFMPLEDGRLSLYEDGVFLTAGQHKGHMLYALLQKTDTGLPSVVIMADDKQKNLDAVKETFGLLDTPVHAWRYSGEDDQVNSFDPQVAYHQWRSIEDALRQIQRVLGPDNYDLDSVVRPSDCKQ